MERLVGNVLLQIDGRFIRVARLRHEWFEFLDEPMALIGLLRKDRHVADVLSFIHDIDRKPPDYPFRREQASAAVLKVRHFDQWFRELDFKVRNKVRKAEKTGVDLRVVTLDDEFAAGVHKIYNESPIRQGRPFWHYGKSAETIKADLSSFPDQTCFVGAYYHDELIGFMKLFRGNTVLRTVHIIAKLSHRDKPVQDALIARAVKMCEESKIEYLHYGNWSIGGLGAFKIKHGFQRADVTRYYAPISLRGSVTLKLNLHQPLRDWFPEPLVERLVNVRARWNGVRFGYKARTV